MKTIAYIDRADANRTLRVYLSGEKRVKRIQEGLAELRRMGNIDIYYVSGRIIGTKIRLIARRGK